MKKLILAVLFASAAFSLPAQQNPQGNFYQTRTIQVTGEAEREVTPDIIYLSISLKEYHRDKNQRRKITIDVLEKQLYDAAMRAGISAEDFMINNISSYNYDWNRKKNDPSFLAAKQYRIRVTNLDAVNQLFASVDPQGIQFSNIDGYDYSDKKDLEKELKIAAIKDAKERANYLAEALGDRVGKALTISESGHINYPQPVVRQFRSTVAEVAMSDSAPSIDFKEVKFTFSVAVVFELL